MIFPIISNAIRPDRIKDEKDDKYHANYSRFIISMCNDPVLLYNLYRYGLNYNFFKGNQWILPDDIEGFLLDSNENYRQRLKFSYNIVYGHVKTWIGAALRTEFRARAYNVSPDNIKNREKEYVKRLAAHRIADAMPLIKNHLQAQFDLGETIGQTEENFIESNEGGDEDLINALFRDCEQRNRFTYLKFLLTLDKVLSGFSVAKEYIEDGEQKWRHQPFQFWYYDTSALKPDLSDAEFMGDLEFYSVPELLEKWEITDKDTIERLELWARSAWQRYPNLWFYGQFFGYPSGKIPVYNNYWRDYEVQRWGYVSDPWGKIYPARLWSETEIKKFENDDFVGEKPLIHTVKDFIKKSLIRPGDVRRNIIKKMNSDGIFIKYKQVPRFCSFVPKEMGGLSDDLLLEWGKVPYSESYRKTPFETPLPYKVSTYYYHMGEVQTPISPIIDPQRLMNQYASQMQVVINKMRLTGMIYDQSIVDAQEGEADLSEAMRKGEDIKVNTRALTGGSLPNAIMPYNGLEGFSEVKSFVDIIEATRSWAEKISGVNSDLMGLSVANRKAVGVQEMNIERGQLLQEDFYFGLAEQYYSIYMCIANKGRKVLADHERELIMKLGGGFMERFKFTRAMNYDEYDVEIRMIPVENIDSNDAKLMQLYLNGVISDKQLGLLFGRSESDQIAKAIRDYSNQKAKMGEELQQQQQEKEQEGLALKQADMLHEKEMQQSGKLADFITQKMKADKKITGDKIKGVNKLLIERMRKKYPQAGGK